MHLLEAASCFASCLPGCLLLCTCSKLPRFADAVDDAPASCFASCFAAMPSALPCLGMALGLMHHRACSCSNAASMLHLFASMLHLAAAPAPASACDCQNSCVQGLLKNVSIMDFYRLVFAQSLQNTFVQTFTPYDASTRFLPPSLHKTSFKDFLHTWLFKDICMRDSKDIVSDMSI